MHNASLNLPGVFCALIGRVITTIILTLSYYLVITPAALIKRVFGGRPLPLKPDKNVFSYWASREEQHNLGSDFLNGSRENSWLISL
jgi:hypothetical protein